MGIITLAFGLFFHQGIWAHGGDNHDFSSTQMLEMRAHDVDHDAHDHSRLSYMAIASSSVSLKEPKERMEPKETYLSDKHQLTAAIAYHLSEVWAIGFTGGAGIDSGLQDPSIGQSVSFPIQSNQFQFIGSASVAPALSVRSLDQGRAATINLLLGSSTTPARWTSGFYAGAALPAYGGGAKNEIHDAEDHVDPKHEEGRERFRTSGTLRTSFKISEDWKVDSSYDLALLDKGRNVSYASEYVVSRLSYIAKSWHAGLALVLREESRLLNFPSESLARISLTVLK